MLKMPEHFTERELLGELRQIRLGGPPPARSDAAVARAVATLGPRRRVAHPVLTAAGLAAALALAAVLWALWPNSAGSQASAATIWAELQEVADRTARFKGWYTVVDDRGQAIRWKNTIDGSEVLRPYDGHKNLVPYIDFKDVERKEWKLWVEP